MFSSTFFQTGTGMKATASSASGQLSRTTTCTSAASARSGQPQVNTKILSDSGSHFINEVMQRGGMGDVITFDVRVHGGVRLFFVFSHLAKTWDFSQVGHNFNL